jgi:hypothetical protein
MNEHSRLSKLVFAMSGAEEFSQKVQISKDGRLIVTVGTAWVKELSFRMEQIGMRMMRNVRRLNQRVMTFEGPISLSDL